MIELTAIIGILLVFIALQEYFNRKERQRLIETIIAKNLGELRDLEVTRKIPHKEENEEPSLIPFTELDDKSFDKYVKDINKIGENNG